MNYDRSIAMKTFAGSRLVFALVLSVSGATAQAVVHVDASRPGGDGSCWAQACRTLEAGLAAGSGQEIWVARGVYTPTAGLKPGAGTAIYGGFAGNETLRSQRDPAANATVVDGWLTLRHVFDLQPVSSNVRLDGLQITRGRATSGTGYDTYAGAILALAAGLVLENCVFSNNTAATMGGALLIQYVDSQILNCTFAGNSSPLGGAVAINDGDALVSGCVFRDNRAVGGAARGGAIWTQDKSPRIAGCEFGGNSAYIGGAVDADPVSMNIADTVFSNNVASNSGGAVAMHYGTGFVERCTFVGNRCQTDNGGGLYSEYAPMRIADSLFQGNRGVAGGAVHLDYRAAGTDVLSRCVFVDNHSTLEGGAFQSYVRTTWLENCWFSGNTSPFGGAVRAHGGITNDNTYDPDMTITLNHCVLYGNYASQHGGAMVNSYVSLAKVYNSIFWNNDCGETFWDPNTGDYKKFKDFYNAGSSFLMTRHSDIETLDDYHYSATVESHTGGFSEDPLFANPEGPDDVLGTPDDDFQLTAASPCIDRADGTFSPALDYLYTPRFDDPDVADLGFGTPAFADVGAFESSPPVHYRDADGDGFGDPNDYVVDEDPQPGYVENRLDWNDANAGVYPGAPEVGDGVDNDGDGQIDEDCRNSSSYFSAGQTIRCAGTGWSRTFVMDLTNFRNLAIQDGYQSYTVNYPLYYNIWTGIYLFGYDSGKFDAVTWAMNLDL